MCVCVLVCVQCVQYVLLINKIQTDSYLCSAWKGKSLAPLTPVGNLLALNLETEWMLFRSSACFLCPSTFPISPPPPFLLSPLLSGSTCNLR